VVTPFVNEKVAVTPPREGRPLRADALRNRAKVLEAAETVFDAHGTGASTEEVAREAGVGIGTVFRHFPTKEALLEAVYVDRLRKLAGEAEALASAGDPREAFFAFFSRVVGHAATKNAFSAALMEAGVDVREASAETGRDLKRALAELLSRAQETGAVRRDVGLPEVMTLLVGAAQAAERVGGDQDVRARALTVVFDGLRAHRS
jgi:AcrR family transcriptional regulator